MSVVTVTMAGQDYADCLGSPQNFGAVMRMPLSKQRPRLAAGQSGWKHPLEAGPPKPKRRRDIPTALRGEAPHSMKSKSGAILSELFRHKRVPVAMR